MTLSKVAFLSLNYKPNVGGLVRYIESFGSFLFMKGIDVHVYCSDAKDEKLPRKEDIDGIMVHRFDVYPNKVFSLFTPFLVCKSFIKELRKSNLDEYDLIIVRHVYLAFALSFFPSLRPRVVYICPLISSKLQEINSEGRGILYRLYSACLIPQLRWIEQFALKKLKNISVLSKSKQKELSDYFNINKIVQVLPPGVDCERFYPPKLEERIMLRKSYGIDDSGAFVFSVVSRLVEEKNISMAIRAFGKLLKSYPSSYLLIAGDGPMLESLECQSEEFECHTRVRFLGFVNEPRKVYAASDCFVLPSTYEGFGHVHLEANACGIPSIGFGTNPPEVITATEEIVEDGANGYVVRELGVEPLYEKMMSAVSVQLKEGRHLTASKCLDVVKSKYSWEQHAANILEIIND